MMITKYIFGLIIVIASLLVIFNLNHYFNKVIEKREIKSNILGLSDTLNFVCGKNIPIFHFKVPYLKNIKYNLTFGDNKVCGRMEGYIFCQKINCKIIKKNIFNSDKNRFNIFNCKIININNILNVSCRPTIE